MDPVGPWSAYASYNRLAGVQAGAASGDFHHHLASSGTGLGSQSVPSTTSQLLLQAAHTTASLAGQLGSSTASPFNPGGFLSPPAVSYDAVFSPLFHHANPKPAHYSSSLQHRQVIAQAQAAVASKQSSVESELSSLRENYSHQAIAAQGTSFFDQPSTPGSTAGLSWQGNNQLPSPFGILPHESVVPSSPSPATTKAGATYDNFNAHFAAAQTLNNHINSQISNAGQKPANRSGSPATASKQPVSSTSSTFFQSPSTYGNQSENSYSTSSSKSGISSQQDYAGSKSYSSSASSAAHSQQSCIVSTPTVTSSPTPPSKDYRSSSSNSTRPSASIYNSQSPKSASSEKTSRPSNTSSGFVSPTSKPPQVQTKAQSKVYPELSSEQRKSCESIEKLQPQSSPISYSIMDAPGRLGFNNSNGSSKSSRIGNSSYSSSQNSSFRHYQSGNNVETEYHVRAKSSSSTDTGYSSSSSQNGPDCSIGAKRQSPLQTAPQTSPLGHRSSPAYPVYHSPMNSINSPQQHTEHYSKVSNPAPRSPLDASISRPPSQNSQVAYPSVITRALGIEQNKSYSESRYERNQSSTPNCWETDRQRKYTSSSGSNNTSNSNSYSTLSENNTHNEKSSQNSSDRLGLSEKHHYFDSNNVALQDLSSCRGDPMSIVKNLQSLQQSCQVQESKTSKNSTIVPNAIPAAKVTRRKSTEKPISHSNELSNAAVMADYLATRIPPPAHSSTTNQQQNGSFFDFERWNLPPPPPKMFPGTSAFGSQAPLHATNFANQHQALAMQHGHALTYFPPFHLGPHPDFQSSVELTPLSSFSETPPSASSSSFSTPETREEEQPKVVVPNIEEELGFLAEQRANSSSTVAPSSQQQNLNSTSQDTTSKIMEKKFNVPVTGPGSGFMASYLKFLQGERDTSPPPAGRGARKSTWSRTNTNSNTVNNKTYNPNDVTKNHCETNSTQQSANGAMASSNALNTGMSLSNPVMSSTASMNATGLLGANQLHGAQANLLGSQAKGVELDDPRYYHLNKDRKRKYDGTEDSAYEAEEEARRLNKPVLNVPSTPLNDKTKKGRATAMNKPTPSAAIAPQPAAPKKPRPPAPPPVASLQAAPQQQYYYQHQPEEVGAHAVGLGYGVYGSSDNDANSNRKLHNIKSHQQISNTGQIDNTRPIEEMPYQSGEFVALKNELSEMWPAIWRVDGKTLLQKYEPFEENGKVLYRNISTYTVWNPENKKLYTQVQVKIRSQTHLETIVELVRSELQGDDCHFIEKRMLETQMYQENFEVYIQTLISHALDPNFLTEIFQEQDEYFLSNVKTVDEVTETMRSRVSSSAGGAGGGGAAGARALDAAVGTWPGLSVAAGAGACRACARPAVARLLLYGQPYNPATLEPVQPDARLAYEKEFLVCSTCCGRVQLYSRISHQKYLMYSECSKRVAEKRLQNPNKDTTVILNELLADEPWLSQLFRDVRHSWAEAESWERKIRHVMSRQMI
ncbi:dentin sialophosphoprotein-like isoform X1 [Zerene cesonia]|uniref:dentin sialophosphoprotein-like isoform X1 n=1 Tax=Zerene cesonia TaxID=33412 RepID=UPI0018E52568|nr:dentin sialophosphoprotein-like isoform X1 [Zerene cesonia]XP_038213778.1 dentin sialophosphoprotein-like isoform X1 [Zerene cesonia]